MVGESVEQRRGHLGIAGEHTRSFPEGEVGGDHDRGGFVELADEVKQELATRLRERQVAEFVEHHEVEPSETIGDVALTAGPCLGFEPVDEVDDVVNRARAPSRMQARAMAMARWVLPVPVPPTSTTLRW